VILTPTTFFSKDSYTTGAKKENVHSAHHEGIWRVKMFTIFPALEDNLLIRRHF
jgi:hypothetical protein